MRNLFIRVTELNETQIGEMKYDERDLELQLRELFQNKKYRGTECYIVKHDRGGVTPHFHVLVKASKSISFSEIKKVFKYGFIEEVRSWDNSLRYLIHKRFYKKTDYYEPEQVYGFRFIQSSFVKKMTISEDISHEYIEKVNSL